MQTAIGVDLGGSHVTAGVVTDDGAIKAQHELDLTDLAFGKVVDAVVTVVQQALADAGKKVAGIGIGSPGNVEPKTGHVFIAMARYYWAASPPTSTG